MPDNTPETPIPTPTPVKISLEYKTVIERFQKGDKTLGIADLVKAQQGDVKKFGKAFDPELKLKLSWFQPNPLGKDGVICIDKSQIKPDAPIRPEEVEKIDTIIDAKKKFRRNKITIEELQAAINTKGQNPGFWPVFNPAKDSRPGTEGNNQSRKGFKYGLDHIKGKIFQLGIKPAILAAINMAHEDMIKQYDQDAFVYDDPRLIYLDNFLKTYAREHVPVNSTQYHLDRLLPIIDILLEI